ncbi:unnamed protein product [Brassica napus]|uniref:(rape) hypothetical protein n=1 Tax=Brassica napus TaxID=3708 RepID=A0A816IH37_BRANA|nr:unnamed protein product [Brassica napus]
MFTLKTKKNIFLLKKYVTVYNFGFPDSENGIWKIKVRVVRMWRFQNGVKPGYVGGIDLILLDDTGDRIQACIRGKLMSKFEEEKENKHDEKVFVDEIGEIVGPCDLKEITQFVVLHVKF